ncbi:MAG: hypothetical protein R3D03_11490 [Geminicoccaceae bacterium]
MTEQVSGDGQWPRIRSQEKVLKAPAIEHLSSIDRYAEVVDGRAREIIAQAEGLREERQREGYEAGLAEGRQVMLQLLLAQQDATGRMLAELEERAVGLVIEATRRVVGTLDHAEVMARMVALGLADLRGYRELTILVPAGFAQRLNQPLRRLVQKRLPEAEVVVRGDENLAVPDCRIVTEGGFLQLSVEALIDGLEREIRERIASDRQALS